jgi:hypothetical protein
MGNKRLTTKNVHLWQSSCCQTPAVSYTTLLFVRFSAGKSEPGAASQFFSVDDKRRRLMRRQAISAIEPTAFATAKVSLGGQSTTPIRRP